MKIRNWGACFFGVMWLILMSWGIIGLTSYSKTPGEVGDISGMWPTESKIQKYTPSPTLLVFLHPECACSEATVAELDRLLAHSPDNVETHVIFIRPTHWSDEKVKSKLWEQAKAIPNVYVEIDSDSSEANLFGAKTSGHTLLYNTKGTLEFSGGITDSRGHSGDNAGRSAIGEILQNQAFLISRTNIFGCGLLDSPTLQRVSKVWNQFFTQSVMR